MEVLLIIGLIVSALVVAGISKGRAQGAAIAEAMNVTMKIKSNIDWLDNHLDEKKFNGADKKHAQYLVAYIDEISRATCVKDGASYDDANRFLVYHKAQNLLGSGEFSDDTSMTKSKALLSEALTSDAGRKGQEDGRKDGAYLVKPSNPGPYFNLACSHFGLPPAERRVE